MHVVSLLFRKALDCEKWVLPWAVLQCIGAGSIHTSVNSTSSLVFLRWHSSCCEPVLQSSTGQWGMHFVRSYALVSFCRAFSTVQTVQSGKRSTSKHSNTLVTPSVRLAASCQERWNMTLLPAAFTQHPSCACNHTQLAQVTVSAKCRQWGDQDQNSWWA